MGECKAWESQITYGYGDSSKLVYVKSKAKRCKWGREIWEKETSEEPGAATEAVDLLVIENNVLGLVKVPTRVEEVAPMP